MGDFFFNLTEWLRTTVLLDWAFWIETTGFNRLMVENFWAVPIAQVLHIVGIGSAFAAVLMLTLRVSGMAGTSRSIPDVSARYIPWIWWGLVWIIVSGILMLWAEPVRNMINGVFWVKMALLLATVLITLAYQKAVTNAATVGGAGWVAGSGVRLTGWFIIILWCLIMAHGRWIAYAPV